MLIKILVSDLDDTLLSKDHIIEEYTVDMIQKAREKGIQMILASGRSPKSMEKYVIQLGLRLPYVGDNGATIVDPLTQNKLHQLLFTPEQVGTCLQFAKEHQLYAQAYDEDSFYYNVQGTDLEKEYTQATGLKGLYVKNLEEKWNAPSSKILLVLEPERVPALFQQAQDRYGKWLKVTTSKPYFLEFSPKQATKGKALQWLEAQGYIQRESAMVFGDSLNDESMLSWAKYPVAMENGREEVKKIAWKIAPPNSQQGVGQMIEKLLTDNKGEMFH